MSYENYDPSFPDQPVVDLYLPIWARLPAFRHKPAFIWAEDGPSFLTYAQLNSAVHSISSTLSQSLHKGDTVVILCDPGLKLVEMIFACQRAGLLAVPVTPPHLSLVNNNNHHHLVRVLSQTKPTAALATRSYIRAAGKRGFSPYQPCILNIFILNFLLPSYLHYISFRVVQATLASFFV